MYYVGDTVTIVGSRTMSDGGEDRWGEEGTGGMDDYLGEPVTIASVELIDYHEEASDDNINYYTIEEDDGEWCWYPEMIVENKLREVDDCCVPDMEQLCSDILRNSISM